MKTQTTFFSKSLKAAVKINAFMRFLMLFLMLGFSHSVISAQSNPVPVQFFYVPLPEDQILQALQTTNTNGSASTNPVQTYISIAAIADNTVIYYDQWENGFEPDIANPMNLYSGGNPGGTQIWGDGNSANGAPPGIPSDIINSGTVIILNNPVTTTSRQSVIDFDGSDKIAATKTISVARSGWTTGPNTLLADAIEVFDTDNWGKSFVVPVGENIPNSDSFRIFNYTGLSIMASTNNTNVQIDADANGSFETNINLNEGQGYLVNGGVKVGAKVTSDKPIQVEIMTGDRGEEYEARWFRLSATSLWSNSYYEPVSTPSSAQNVNGTSTVVWLYNANPFNITVQYQTRTGSGGNTISTNPINVNANGYAKQVIPDGYGAKFYTNDGSKFYALSATDANNSNQNLGANRTWDWGFTLVSESSLTSQILIGLGIGRDPTSGTNPNENGNPVYVTPIGNGNTAVTVYIDYDADPSTGPLTDPFGNKYNTSVSLRELDRAKVYNPSGNQTGMLLYTLEPNVKLAGAWGQDPLTASAAAPGLDVGNGIPPIPLFDAGKNGTLFQDNDGDGFISPGDDILYTIVINNISRAPVPDIKLVDNFPANTTYIPNSTFFNNAFNVTSQINDDGSGTAFPLDGNGLILDNSSALPVGGSYEVTFKTRINDFEDLEPNTENIINTGFVTAVGDTIDISAITPLFGRIGDFLWDDENQNGIQDLGETGIANVTVKLYDGFGQLVATTVTNGLGKYQFLGLLPGSYQVEFVNPSIYDFTTQNADAQGINGANNSDVNPLTGKTAIFTLAGGEINYNVDAGLKPNASIGDRVWDDTNENGIQDNGENGMPNITVELYRCSDNSLVTSTVTNVNGNYSFNNLIGGDYYVQFTVPIGYTVSPAFQGGNNQTDSNPDATGKTSCITLTAGEHNTTIDAGFFETPVPQDADLKIEKSVDEQNPNCGDNVTFTINVTNLGPGTALDVVVTDVLPAGLDYQSSNASVGSYDDNTGTWTIGTLAFNEIATLTINVIVDCASINSTSIDFGAAEDFNLFVLEDLTQPSSDTQGKVAVGHDANLGGYSIGDQLPANSGDVLIVGNNLTYTSGSVLNGNVVYGNSTNLPHNAVSISGTLSQGYPIDFAAAKTYLENLSTTLGAYTVNGTVTMQWGGLKLTGTDPFLNVFAVNGSDLSSANDFQINVPNGSVVLVNINGTNVSWMGGLTVNGTAIYNVLYNFYEATNLSISGIDIRGTILAPFADLNFPSGVVNGQVIVKSMSGSGQFNLTLFQGNIPVDRMITNYACVTSSTDDNNANNNSSSATINIGSVDDGGDNGGGTGGNDGGNNGGSWSNVYSFTQGQIICSLLYDNNTIYAGTLGGKIYKSIDNGNNWTLINNGMNVGFIWSFVKNGSYIFAATENGVYRYDGNNWTLTSLNGKDVHTLTVHGSVIFAGTWGYGIFKSTDNGNTWLPENSGLGYFLTVQSLTVYNGEIFAGTIGGGLYKSTDGSTWTKVTCDYQLIWSLGSTDNAIFAGTYGDGLYRSTDGGSTFTKLVSIPVSFIYSIVTDASGNIFVSSLTNGVFVSSDNGDTWTALGMNGFGVSTLMVNPSTSDVYVGTKEGAVYKMNGLNGATAVDNVNEIPTEFKLAQNYPNPFNPSTTIEFAVPAAGSFNVKVYDVIGREVATLMDKDVNAGNYKVTFDASRLASGIYIYRLVGNNVNITKKMMLIK